MCKKAGYKLMVLSRLSKTIDMEAKLLLLNSFILSFFHYCSVVWHFCNHQSAKCIEKLQERALRFVYNDFKSSYKKLRELSGKPLVYTQRLRSLLTEVQRSVNHEGPVYMTDMFKRKVLSYNIRNTNCLILPKVNSVKYGFNSFRYQGAKLWNSLDDNLKDLDVHDFKHSITKWYPKPCSCSLCHLCKMNSL